MDHSSDAAVRDLFPKSTEAGQLTGELEWLFPDWTIDTNTLASAGGENQVSTCDMAAGDQADAPEWSHTCSPIGTGSPSCNPDHPGTGDSSCSPDTIFGTGVYSCSPLIHNTGIGARADAHQQGHTCNPNTNTHVTGTSDYTCSPSYHVNALVLNRTCGTEPN